MTFVRMYISEATGVVRDAYRYDHSLGVIQFIVQFIFAPLVAGLLLYTLVLLAVAAPIAIVVLVGSWLIVRVIWIRVIGSERAPRGFRER